MFVQKSFPSLAIGACRPCIKFQLYMFHRITCLLIYKAMQSLIYHGFRYYYWISTFKRFAYTCLASTVRPLGSTYTVTFVMMVHHIFASFLSFFCLTFYTIVIKSIIISVYNVRMFFFYT